MRWIYRRLIITFFTIFVASSIIFFLIRNMPPYSFSPLPLHEQYFMYITRTFRGDLGRSRRFAGIPVIEIACRSLPWTIFTVSTGFLASFTAGMVLGIIAAYKRGSPLDTLISIISTIDAAIPNYLFALILLVLFAGMINLFPGFGAYDADKVTPGLNIPFILNVLHHAALPILSYFIASFGSWALYMRSNTISVLREEYVFAAKARGLKDSRIAWKYVGRNAMLPLFTLMAINLGYVFGGSTLIEYVFSYPGIGYYISIGISARDYPLMQGLFFILTVAGTLSNLMADIIYSRLDPRARFE